MKKTKIKFHHRVIHPNRNLLWAFSVVLVVGLALSSYIYVTGLQEDFGAIFSPILHRKIFVSQVQHYSARYPENWQLEKDSKENSIFENPVDTQESISVALAKFGDEK